MMLIPRAADLLSGEPAFPVRLPPLLVTPTAAHLFMFSAATWNRHHNHYRAQAARAEGHGDVVVHRGLIGNYLARMLTNWLGNRGEIRSLSWKVVRSAGPGRPLRCEGEVVSQEVHHPHRRLQCELRVVDAEHNLIAQGAAGLELEVHG